MRRASVLTIMFRSQLPVFVRDPERSDETLTFETLFPTGTRPQLYTMCCHCDVAVML